MTRMRRMLPLTRFGKIIVVVLIALAGALMAYELIVLPQRTDAGRSADTPMIGGAFAMVDQNGRMVTEKDFLGKFMLVYFGYTYCPDVCPTSLTVMASALDLLGDKARNVVPIFVTIDPERDTVEQMRMYVAHFSPRMVGLTGTPEDVTAIAKAYRVYYARVKGEGSGPDDYLMDHTAIIYLMGPDGRYLTHFPHDADPAAVARRIEQYL